MCTAILRSLANNPLGMTSFITKYVTESLMNITTETLGVFDESCFTTAFGLFAFSFSCTIVSLIPHIEEATRDLNTTFALALISFFFVQQQGFKAHGVAHLKEYTHPFIFMLPMHIVGDLAKITSMSFRLFGNILAGSVILHLMYLALERIFPYLGGYFIFVGLLTLFVFLLQRFSSKYANLSAHLPKLYAIFFIPAGLQFFFGLFEGLIQSGVIALLTLTYTGLAINTTDNE